MTQADIIKLLEKNKGKKFLAKQISEKLKISGGSGSLKKLRERNDIRYELKKINCSQAYLYWI